MLGVGISPPLLMNQQSIPRRVRSILNKYDATMLLPGVAEPILGPELVGSAWVDASAAPATATFSAGVLTLNATGGTSRGRTSITTVANRTYRVTARKLNAGSDCTLDIGTSAGGSQLSVNNTVGTSGVSITFVATTTQTWLNFYRGATSVTDVTDISVREILGYNHTRYSYQAGNYRESTGQTLAAADQQVGFVVDAARVPGPELRGGGSVATLGAPNPLATYNSATGAGTINRVDGSNVSGVQIPVGGSGRLIQISISVSSVTGTISVRGNGVAGTVLLNTIASAPGNYTAHVVSDTSNIFITGGTNGTSASFVINSVRELPGIHASQSTSGFQPVLRRGLVNLLTYSADFSNTAWATTGSSKVGNKLVEDTSTGTHIVMRSTSGTNGEAVTLAAVIEAAGRNYAHISISGATHAATINLTNGVVNAATGSPIQISSVNLGSGKWLLSLSGAYSTVVNQCNFYTSADGVWANRSYTGDGTSGIVMHSAAFFQGTVTADQIIAAGGIPVTTSAPASSANGIQSWQFDGSDDRLSLSAVPFQMSDDHFVVAGFNQKTIGARSTLFYSGGTNSTPMCPRLSVEPSGSVMAAWRGDSGVTATVFSPVITAGDAVVASARRASGTGVLRLNGSLLGFSATNPGTTTLTQSFIGCGAGGAPVYDFHNGHIHGVIFGKGAISDSELLTLEKFMATLQGRTL